jgi:hypothetical protein
MNGFLSKEHPAPLTDSLLFYPQGNHVFHSRTMKSNDSAATRLFVVFAKNRKAVQYY